MIKWDLFQLCKEGSTLTNYSTLYTTLTKRKIKITLSSNRCIKSILSNLISIHNKNFHQSGYTGDIT